MHGVPVLHVHVSHSFASAVSIVTVVLAVFMGACLLPIACFQPVPSQQERSRGTIRYLLLGTGVRPVVAPSRVLPSSDMVEFVIEICRAHFESVDLMPRQSAYWILLPELQSERQRICEQSKTSLSNFVVLLH